jgi:hypothetical protein
MAESDLPYISLQTQKVPYPSDSYAYVEETTEQPNGPSAHESRIEH